MVGPHQADTSPTYWRWLTDTFMERKTDRLTVAFEYIYSTENMVAPGNPRALMMSSQLPVHWTVTPRWSATVRPEIFWDRDGRWTSSRQTVKAVTTPLEYRVPSKQASAIFPPDHPHHPSRRPQPAVSQGLHPP